MQAHRVVVALIFESEKFFQSVTKKNKIKIIIIEKPDPIHFHKTYFYQTGIIIRLSGGYNICLISSK